MPEVFLFLDSLNDSGLILAVLSFFCVFCLVAFLFAPWICYWFSENYYRRELHGSRSFFRHVVLPLWGFLGCWCGLLFLVFFGFVCLL